MDTTAAAVDRDELESKVRELYRLVAQHPAGKYHFRMGRGLAEQLGYPAPLLDLIPAGAVESFAGVGYFFDLANLAAGESVLDLGSGSGMDVFAAALAVGRDGNVVGVDMTPEQLGKAEGLRADADFPHVTFVEGRIDDLPFADASFDCVISNGVINLSPDKGAVFREAARVLRPGGRLAIADIVTEKPLSPKIVCNTDLWAACIGGAAQTATYQEMMTGSGFAIEAARTNIYEFLSDSARSASEKYGVTSVSFLAHR
ncbi:methyltransferase domain-containing protein [Arthrobacter sp. B10-11]|uniref:methyltransferase domain-containing protein n=1 Tax=Arthrobacter sp. B10-11 TaxID=3081160 RepID=UPI00295360BF|nr:methyltransferase domain-containing protein [Arthrobacter sp. B10-11]MDV8146960.1 methyltransferase domain-containing protein [Arthrobacter sp. B10-11]